MNLELRRQPLPRFLSWAWCFACACVALVLLADPASSVAGRRTRKPAKAAASAADSSRSNISAADTGPLDASPSGASTSASASSPRPKKLGAFNPADDTVEMFAALEAGQIAVKLIPKDSTEGRVFIRNKTQKPLNVKLPEAFAATPVLAQMGGGGQGMGGGGGGGGGMGMMNVPAEKELNLRVPCVCLEHGKPEPRPKMTYEVKPVTSFTKKPGISELLTRLGSGEIEQRAAQAAAWHLNNEMSWDELAEKKIDYVDGTSEPYFSDDELSEGMAAARQSLADAEKPSEIRPSSPGETAQRAD
ncbi:MAG TPA: hypothetical protein VF306_20095 [Pirellulales bacterium]